MLCIGGVCIPYSALWPLVLLFLRPVLQYLFPNFYAKKGEDKLKVNMMTTIPSTKEEDEDSGIKKVYQEGVIANIESETEFAAIVKTSNQAIIKFTASWCKPCHAIQPVYEDLAKSYPRIRFAVVDVDKLETVATEWEALRIPYFVTIKNGEKIDSAVTTSKEKLAGMIQSLLS